MAPKRRNFQNKNKFGYNNTKSPPGQFRRVLDMENDEEGEEILSIIRRLTIKELDVNLTGNLQERKISSIESQLKQIYPDTFGLAVEEGERRLYFAHKYILYVHTTNRSRKEKERKKMRQKRKKGAKECVKAMESSASLGRQSSLGDSSSQTETSPPNTRSISKSTKRNQENIPPSGSVIDPTPQALKPGRISTARSQALPSKTFAQDSRSVPSQNLAALPPTYSLGATAVPSNQYGATVRPIYEFLDTCLPSMTHHLQSFLDFGCDTPEHLFGMSMWQPGMIHEVLDKLPPNAHGERLTEMEKLIIQNHVLTYFKS